MTLDPTTWLPPRPDSAPASPPALLGPGDPPPVSVLRPTGTSPVLLVCDHAANAIPAALGNLGVATADRVRHIGWDIGAAVLTRDLSARLDATAVLAGYSRLVVDLNRPLDSPTLMPVVSDGTTIPGNAGLDTAARRQRLDALFHPYHQAVRDIVMARHAAGRPTVLLSVHSFTPVMAGQARPWHAGLLWNADRRLAGALIDPLAREKGLVVGDNAPYSGQDPEGYTLRAHAEAMGLPGCLVEVRQDLLADAAGVAAWGHRLEGALKGALRELT